MNTVIDNLDTATDWTGTGTVAVHGLNEHKDFIAGGNLKSLVLSFPSGNSGNYATKDLATPIDVLDYNDLVFSIWSRSKGNSIYETEGDFLYTLDLGDGKQFDIPVWETFSQVSVDISDIDTIERIRIIANHNDADYILISYMIAVTDDIPADIFSAFKAGLESARAEIFPYGGPLVATVSADMGDTEITFEGNRYYLAEDAVVYITDGVNTETHQLKEGEGDTFTMSELYDGAEILNDYTDADVYLQYPVEFGPYEKEAIFPGVGIWGFVPTPMHHVPHRDANIKGYSGGKFQFRLGGLSESWRIVIDAQAKDPDNIADMTRFIRKYLSRCVAWINGRDFDFEWMDPPADETPDDAMNIIPHLSYIVDIEIVEDVESDEERTAAVTQNLTVNIEEQGGI